MQDYSAGNAIVAFPSAVNGNWDLTGATDLAFFDAMTASLESTLCVNERRIFVLGFSLGAYMANSLGCHRSGAIRAFIPADGGFPGATAGCGKTTVLVYHRAEDDNEPIATGSASTAAPRRARRSPTSASPASAASSTKAARRPPPSRGATTRRPAPTSTTFATSTASRCGTGSITSEPDLARTACRPPDRCPPRHTPCAPPATHGRCLERTGVTRMSGRRGRRRPRSAYWRAEQGAPTRARHPELAPSTSGMRRATVPCHEPAGTLPPSSGGRRRARRRGGLPAGRPFEADRESCAGRRTRGSGRPGRGRVDPGRLRRRALNSA